MFYQLMLPFDNGSGTNGAAGFYNASSQPVTLTLHLNDVEGKPVATKELSALGAGESVTGTVADFFGGAHATRGSITVYSGSPVNLLMSAVAVRQTSKGAFLSSTPGVVQFSTGAGTPRTVTPTLDTTNQATADINVTGGSLSVSDAKGNHFTLTIPPSALLDQTTITMTAISSATGLADPGLVAGVQLEPDGLVLFQPALLKIDLASPAPDGVMSIGWRGDTPGVYVNPVLPDPKSLTISLTHFSGAGLGRNLTDDLLYIDNKMDLIISTAGELLAENRQAQLLGKETLAERVQSDIQTLFTASYKFVIVQFMQLAESSKDPDVIRCALMHVLAYESQRQKLGVAVGAYTDDDPISVDVKLFAYKTVPDILFPLLIKRCQQHDFTVYYDLAGAYRQFSLWGVVLTAENDEHNLQSCLPQVELDYNSEMTGVISAQSAGNINWDATIQGSLVMKGEFLTNELNHISDPSQDLFTSFDVTGSGMEIYNTPNLFFPPGPCTEFIQSNRAATMTVEPNNPNATGDLSTSRIEFQFDPHYDPAVKDMKDQQLCSFCPVYRKKP